MLMNQKFQMTLNNQETSLLDSPVYLDQQDHQQQSGFIVPSIVIHGEDSIGDGVNADDEDNSKSKICLIKKPVLHCCFLLKVYQFN